MPPGNVAMPRLWALGSSPETVPYDSGAGTSLSVAKSAPKRVAEIDIVRQCRDQVVVAWVDHAVAVGVLDGEQVDLRRELNAGRKVSAQADRRHKARAAHASKSCPGCSDSIRLRAAVIVDWLMNRTVRDVSGAGSLEKNAAVRALATAPSIANTSVSGSQAHAGFDADAEDACRCGRRWR